MRPPLSKTALAAVFEAAQQAYPDECCGFILLDGTVHRAENIQDRLHASNPTRYPRDARRGYTMSPEDLRILDQSFETQAPAAVIYHSHPDVGAYFSDEDYERAIFCGALVYPVNQLVIDVRQGRAVEAIEFSYLDQTFQPIRRFRPDGLCSQEIQSDTDYDT